MDHYPNVSIVIPTLNSERTIERCLQSINNQDYPMDKMEVIIVDAGSVDKTLEICKKHTVSKILDNPLKTGEAGKSVGIKVSSHDLIVLLDSDNLMGEKDWLIKMTVPFGDRSFYQAEPLYWTYVKTDPAINRYFTITAVNDPICFFLGNYSRFCYYSNKWTEMPVAKEIDLGNYLDVVLYKNQIPTFGANGYTFRKTILDHVAWEPYFYDIDVVYSLAQKGFTRIARPKVSTHHLFCNTISTYVRKQKRRINDYLYFRANQQRNYHYSLFSINFLKYLLYTLTIVPLFIQAFYGYSKKKDVAWFFHPIICWITLIIYSTGYLRGMINKKMYQRDKWQQ